jgi:hypothetical protein
MRVCERTTEYKIYDAKGVFIREGHGRRKDFERLVSLTEARVIKGALKGELPLRIEEVVAVVADVRA